MTFFFCLVFILEMIMTYKYLHNVIYLISDDDKNKQWGKWKRNKSQRWARKPVCFVAEWFGRFFFLSLRDILRLSGQVLIRILSNKPVVTVFRYPVTMVCKPSIVELRPTYHKFFTLETTNNNSEFFLFHTISDASLIEWPISKTPIASRVCYSSLIKAMKRGMLRLMQKP